MNDNVLLRSLALIEGGVFVSIVLFLVIHRFYTTRRRDILARERKRIMDALTSWVLGTSTGEALAHTLSAHEGSGTVRQLILIVASHVPEAQRDELAKILRQDAWVGTIKRYAKSVFWWRRMGAAQMLSLTATDSDEATMARLVADENITVQTAAVRSLLRIPRVPLIAMVLDRLPRQPAILRAIQGETLHKLWTLTLPLLVERLTHRNAPADHLEAWINFADLIGAPDTLEPIIALHNHPDANVRIATAKALRRGYQTSAASALMTLLDDTDWRVRGQAARGLGALAVQSAIPQLRDALGDSNWWVRFRAGLALAQMGESGRRALREARTTPDKFAADMAAMVSGLSDGSITELAEA
jgi:hypothetical protein